MKLALVRSALVTRLVALVATLLTAATVAPAVAEAGGEAPGAAPAAPAPSTLPGNGDGTGGAAARDAGEGVRPFVGLAVGKVVPIFGDDDQFAGTLITGFGGVRLGRRTAVAVRAHHSQDEILDPFDAPLDHEDRLALALASVRFGRVVWGELGVGGGYRWRHYRDGHDDDRARFAFDLLTGVSLGGRGVAVQLDAAVGLVSDLGLVVMIGGSTR